MSLTNLQELSIYTVTVTARAFGTPRTSTHEFTTLPTGIGLVRLKLLHNILAITIVIYLFLFIVPTGSPQNIAFFVTSRSVSVSWNEIECIERNGMITNYTVEFSSLGGSVIPGVLMVDERPRFTANGLTPFTNYTFRVAGINSIGTGPFSDLITIQTVEDSKAAWHSS